MNMSNNIKAVYFLGAGGIGMSALERFFLSRGIAVGGYDKTPSELTKQLEKEGVAIHYNDDINLIPDIFKDKNSTLIVYTPAIPESHKEFNYFKDNGFELQKRAQVLGTITHSLKGLCVAGTHGKTTTTSMIAHILHNSNIGCNAFLGGILKNINTNYIGSTKSDYVVIEADEFDRSFHHLTPYISVITATDADHLDIYGTKEAYLESFAHYSSLIQDTLLIHTGLELKPRLREGVKMLTYGREAGDYHASNIRIGNGRIIFDFISPINNVKDIELGVPVSINIENSIAAMAVAQMCGATSDDLKNGILTFQGVDRRFDFKIKNDNLVLLSDYAHHPKEIEQCVKSLKEVFNGRKISTIFQPHLYTRTRDFYQDFADALSLFDEIILTEIYPARELPIKGVTSNLIYDNIKLGVEKHLINKKDVLSFVKNKDFDVLVILGAGDLENMIDEIGKNLKVGN